MDRFLSTLPDPALMSHDETLAWVENRIAIAKQTCFTPETMATFQAVEVKSTEEHSFGAEASPEWRRFFLATLLADWLSYEEPADRFDYARLKYVMSSAYQYFKVWGCALPDGTWLPVGYTAWYPIAKYLFDGLRDHATVIDGRGVFMPLRHIRRERITHVYIVNISIIGSLFNTVCAGRMIRAFRSDGQAFDNVGIAAIAVGSQGIKFAKLGGLAKVGEIVVNGATEVLLMKNPIS